MEFRIGVEAEEDIELARLFYEAEALGLGERFHADVLATLDYIGLWPKGFQLRYLHYRFAPLAVFPFHIIYSLEGDFIVVHRIRHMHQRPLRRYFGTQG